MSEMKPDVDLAALSREPTVARPKRRRLVRLVPLLLLLGFAAVLLSTMSDLWHGTLAVRVIRPQPVSVASGRSAASALQRSGWVEPDPFATEVAALATGVIDQFAHLEGESVKAGEPIATLVRRDAEIELDRARAAELRAAAEAENAHAAFGAALEVTETLAVATSRAAGREAELDRRRAAAQAGQAQVRVATEELELARYLAENGGAGPRQVELAQAKLDADHAALAQLEAEAARAVAELDEAKANLARATKERELRLADQLRVATADAALAEARSQLAAAELRLDRMTIRAPCDGVLLQRLAAPGALVGTDAKPAIATLYDPAHLRVRVDVEQSEVAKLALGQRAEVRAPTRADRPYHGAITRIVRQANVEKVTLQVQIALDDPDDSLRPELLVEAHFLARAREPAKGDDNGADNSAGADVAASGVTIPARLLVGSGTRRSVWIVDPIGRCATMREVEIEGDVGDRATIRRGLDLSDKLIDLDALPAGERDALKDGRRVTITSSTTGETGDAATGGR